MKKIFFLGLTGLLLCFNSFSQSVEINDFMRLNPYSNFNNPANFIPYNGYVGIPMISNINFSFYNSGFLIKNFIETNKDGSSNFSYNKFVNSLSKNNWLNTTLNLELLGFGFRVHKFFFSLSYQIKMEQQLKYSQDFFAFFLQNQDNHLFTRSFLAEIEICPNLNLYQEVSLGFQGQILANLYIGARPKLLFGIANLQTKTLKASAYYDPSQKEVYGRIDADIKMASTIPFYYFDHNGEFRFGTDRDNNPQRLLNNSFSNNMGFAIDLGAMYRINQQIRVSAAVTDLGFIKWKSSAMTLSIEPAASGEFYEFSGFVDHLLSNLFNSEIDIVNDSIFKSNRIIEEVGSYKTMLTTKIMGNTYFDLNPYNRFILQFKGYIVGKNFLPQFTVAYNGTFFNLIDLVVSYSVMKRSYANLGLGLGFRMGPIHLYAGTDNVLAAVIPLNSKRINATFGLLVDFPVRAKVKEPVLKSLFREKEETRENQKTKE
jgi:hypothetical protein